MDKRKTVFTAVVIGAGIIAIIDSRKLFVCVLVISLLH